MQLAASHKFDASRQNVDGDERNDQGCDSYRSHLMIPGLALHSVLDEHQRNQWAEYGYDHLRGTSNAFEHVLPPIVICNRRTDDAFLEAMVRRGALHSAIAAAVVVGLVALAGSVGLSRVEHATVIAARV
ncbi:hypothetical protein HJB72_28435 [Rhizobium lentis]|uniref:hypothetical protein n=1 Tax=Rhizobium lentis TaxID=1138194 RepID=UPI001C83BF17|nr:hypothetical protein [Rhizobium lentis]MBX5001853.1 hypothetical protein [Rhizobium lentis]